MPRISITRLLAGLPILAADFAWLRWYLIRGHRSAFGLDPMALDLGIIPTASLLSLCVCLLASSRRESAGFLLGCTAGLLIGLAAYVGCCLAIPEAIDQAIQGILAGHETWPASGPLKLLAAPIGDLIASTGTPRRYDLLEMTWITMLMGVPQLMIAFLVGWIVRRSRRSRRPGTDQNEVTPSVHDPLGLQEAKREIKASGTKP